MSFMSIQRIITLDIFRGILVLGMIVFHSSFHLFNGEVNQNLFHWVPTGFVLFAGILIGNVLRDRKTTEYFFYRGLKLLLFVALLNLPLWIRYEVPPVEIMRLFLLGNPSFSAFEILIPIALVIMTAGVLLRIPRLIGIVFFTSILLLMDVLQSHHFTFKFYTIGALGVFLGQMNVSPLLLSFSKKTGALFAAIGSFLLFYLLSVIPAVWTLQVILALLLFGWLPFFLQKNKKLESFCVLLGKYSLFLYIFHVAVIRVLALLSIFPITHQVILWGEIVILSFLCWIVVYWLDMLRQRYSWLNTTYRSIF